MGLVSCLQNLDFMPQNRFYCSKKHGPTLLSSLQLLLPSMESPFHVSTMSTSKLKDPAHNHTHIYVGAYTSSKLKSLGIIAYEEIYCNEHLAPFDSH